MSEILFVTDFVCPFCIVAKEALLAAMEETGIHADIRIRPLELTEEPGERVDTYHDEQRKNHYGVLEAPAEELGLDVKFPPNVVPRPYTRLAFEGWYFAEEKGCGGRYADLVYRAYFIDEKDIGEPDVLAGLAKAAGLDPEEFLQALNEGTYTAREKEAVRYSKEVLKVEGVPTIYIDGKQVELSEYSKAEMARILREHVK